VHLLQKPLIVAIVIAALVISAGAAMAHGYSGSAMTMVLPAARDYTGSWPVTVTHTQHGFTGCLTLTQSSSNGGSASLVVGTQKYQYGTFQIFNRTLVATLQAPGYAQNAGLVFIGSAGRSNIGAGVFDEVYGGEAFVEGALAFGAKGGC
jgi:hypothetical protein